jgi:hypothetical protein
MELQISKREKLDEMPSFIDETALLAPHPRPLSCCTSPPAPLLQERGGVLSI